MRAEQREAIVIKSVCSTTRHTQTDTHKRTKFGTNKTFPLFVLQYDMVCVAWRSACGSGEGVVKDGGFTNTTPAVV